MKSKSETPLLSIMPLGGVGEIGSNMTVIESNDRYLVIDYGILFPYEDFYDINYLIVNTDSIDPEKEITLFITHGHEDHIGAVSHFVQKFPNCKIYSPEFASTLIRKKLEQRNLTSKINVYRESDIIPFDVFHIHPVHVTHSIPDTFGIVLIDTAKAISVLFISDFKFDLNPLYENKFNLEKITSLFNSAEKRVCLLDSTNILVPGKTLSESDLVADLDELISRDRRTFITLFSSNIFRLKTIFELAQKHSKTVVTIGRSLSFYLETANEHKIIDLSQAPIKDISDLKNYDDPNLVVLLTGCQGDFMGALRRVASREQREFKLKSGDQVIFSSKAIPGNNKKLSRIYNDLTVQGADVITDRDYKIHASGHPGQEDLRLLLNAINPTDYIPIHGESYFLKRHQDFVDKNFGFNTHLLSNYDKFTVFKDLMISISVHPPTQPDIIHSRDIVIERERISERRKMACNGVVFISLNMKSRKIQITSKGLPNMIEGYMETFTDQLSQCAFGDNKNKSNDIVCENTRVKARQIFNNVLGYKPITLVNSL